VTPPASNGREFRALDAVVVIVILYALLALLGFALPKTTPRAWVMVAAGLSIPVGVVIGILIRRRSPAAVLAPGRVTPGLVYWTLFGTAGLTVVFVSLAQPFLDLFPRYKPEIEKLSRDVGSLPSTFALLWIGLVVPIGEEMLFRGALLRGFRASWGTVAGLVGSSAIFALAHEIPPRMVATFFIGLWLGGLALKSGGLAVSVLGHAVNNTLVLVLGFADVQQVSPVFAAPGAAAFLLSAWRLFRSPGARRGDESSRS